MVLYKLAAYKEVVISIFETAGTSDSRTPKFKSQQKEWNVYFESTFY